MIDFISVGMPTSLVTKNISIESIEAMKSDESKDILPLDSACFSGFADTVEESVKVYEAVDWEHFAAFRNINPVDDAALWTAGE